MEFIEKPWGYEKWLEVNDNYVVKELYMKAGHSCSLQYHEKKKETFYVVEGKLRFFVGEKVEDLQVVELEPKQSYTIEPFIIHRMEAIVDSIYIEASTNFLQDVIRIQDNYGRA